MAHNPLTELDASGQSPWIDFILRSNMQQGKFAALIEAGEIVGATSNPSIFEKAIGGSQDYDEQIAQLVKGGMTDTKKIFDELAVLDIQTAADNLRPVYDRTHGLDGYISLEVSPGAANNMESTLAEARYLWGRVQRPNVMIKVPATPEGIPAVEQLIAEGININITLIFALSVYETVAQAYIKGLETRIAANQPIDKIASVASFFISRVDSEIDKRLDAKIAATSDATQQEQLRGLQGKAAIANAKLAYERYLQLFKSDRFAALAAKGAHPQRCLWASTSTKNPNYRDVLYVEQLIGPETVNTMPPATIDAFRDHGIVAQTITADLDQAHAMLEQLATAGISIDEVTQKLQIDGVKLFADAFDNLMEKTQQKVAELQRATGATVNPNSSLGTFTSAVAEALHDLDQEVAGQRLWRKDATFWNVESADEHRIRSRLGWLDSAKLMENSFSALEQFAHEVRGAGFTQVVVLGMGGSSLCALVLMQTFGNREGFPTLRVLDSTAPSAVLDLDFQSDLSHTLFIVSSKSGTTLETNAYFHYFYERLYALRGMEAGQHFIAITDPGTALEALANTCNFRQIFRNPPDIGGRYSALSFFGLVPAAVMGVDLGALLDSSLDMTAQCGPDHLAERSPGLWLGATLGAAHRVGRDKLTLIASPPIASIGVWIEQLLAESTGKDGRGIVPIVNEPLGTPDQYGQDRLFVYLRTDHDYDPTQDAAVDALEASGQPVVRLPLSSIFALFGEFYRWEFATAVAGHFLGINPFDELNVQESKEKTKQLLATYVRTQSLPTLPISLTEGIVTVTAEHEMADAISGATTVSQALTQVVQQLARAGDYVAFQVYLQPTPALDAMLQRVRSSILTAQHLATTFGYGPRYLHSTGQLHKGGPNTGIFIQIVASDRERVIIPGQDYDFDTLIQAQSLGDYQTLQAHQRRVLRVNLNDDIRGGMALIAGY